MAGAFYPIPIPYLVHDGVNLTRGKLRELAQRVLVAKQSWLTNSRTECDPRILHVAVEPYCRVCTFAMALSCCGIGAEEFMGKCWRLSLICWEFDCHGSKRANAGPMVKPDNWLEAKWGTWGSGFSAGILFNWEAMLPMTNHGTRPDCKGSPCFFFSRCEAVNCVNLMRLPTFCQTLDLMSGFYSWHGCTLRILEAMFVRLAPSFPQQNPTLLENQLLHMISGEFFVCLPHFQVSKKKGCRVQRALTTSIRMLPQSNCADPDSKTGTRSILLRCMQPKTPWVVLPTSWRFTLASWAKQLLRPGLHCLSCADAESELPLHYWLVVLPIRASVDLQPNFEMVISMAPDAFKKFRVQ